ncbi:hypothetical protein HYDPIDRAFT_28157 [Hydnomerulius pinastri MD-312]|uniref:DUF6534 domain-containing protein n=1 Tax=Hydnomerulius pinastri MD-312 TaxID=994086 RepID=A0A0C9WFG2_9AGAM|nr:hypothetical protein HYDPIDRAFT_28157 [Hydnomerulius pinastri MD-312]
MSIVAAAGVDLGLTWGSALAGTFVTLVFYGVSILQTFAYYLWYPKDRCYLKLLVAAIFVLDTAHKFMLCISVWKYLVQNCGDYAYLAVANVFEVVSLLISSFVSFIVQTYFVWRICFLSTGRFKWFFPSLLMPAVTAVLALGIYTVVAELINPTIPIPRRILQVAKAYNGGSAAIDIAIAISLCTLLAMGRTGFNRSTDRMLFRLIVISVNTGLWTALFGLLTMVFMAVFPIDLVFTGVYNPLCTLYCNTLLANLNLREYARGADEVDSLPTMPSSIRYRSHSSQSKSTVGVETKTAESEHF